MPKATLMVRFRPEGASTWLRRPAAYGSTGRVKSGFAVFKDPKTLQLKAEKVGPNYTYDIRIEDGTTTYQAAGKVAADAEAQRVTVAGKLAAKAQSKAVGLIVIDPAKEAKKKPRLEDVFDDYIEDASGRNALEAWEQAVRAKAEFFAAVKVTYADQVTRETILAYDGWLRDKENGDRTIFNKRQRLQSMLRWAGVDPKIFPPKPKFERALPTIYTQAQLRGLFGVARPYQKMVCNLALKLGLRDREVQFAEFSDIIWEESVFRVQGKEILGTNEKTYIFKVKDYEQRDIPIPLDFLSELKDWKKEHPGQNLIVPSSKGNPNPKLLKMIKRMARRAGIECGCCPNCIEGVKGERGCDEFELHKFRRTCITTWLRSKLDPRTVMSYAGHADLETTLRYLRPAAAHEKIAAVSEITWY